MKRFAAVTATAFAVTTILTACSGFGKEKAGEVSANESETQEEYSIASYDWEDLNTSEKGWGKRTSDTVPNVYYVPDGYYQTAQSNKLVEGVRRTTFSIRLTGLKDTVMMENINTVVSDAQTALKNDVSWVNEQAKAELLSSVEGAAEVEPTNYSAADVTVFGHILSINILYLHIYNINDADGNHLQEETVDEGRLLMNFDLRTGKVISLPELFYDDVDYISLIAEYVNKVGAEVGYRFVKAVNGLPDDYDVFCLSGSGFVIGLTADNPFIRGGEETWFSILLSDLIDSMDIDPQETCHYFDTDIVIGKRAFRVKDIGFTETRVKDLFSEQRITLPLVSGIEAAEKINADLSNWYQIITDPLNYPEEALRAGGSISAETQAPCGLVNITVFVYSAASNEYTTLARCYDAKTGEQLRVGDLLTKDAAERYGSGVAAAESFRVSDTFLIGVPEQDGVEEYLLTVEGDMDMKRFG